MSPHGKVDHRRKQVLRGDEQSSLRSVNSQFECPEIESKVGLTSEFLLSSDEGTTLFVPYGLER